MTATIRVNGEPQPLAATATITDLLVRLGLDPDRRGTAVAVNGTVVPRSRWAGAAVADGDDIEIVHPLQGG